MRTAAMVVLGVALLVLGAAGYQLWAQSELHKPGSSYFPDCPPTNPHDENIGFLIEALVTQGYPDGTYQPSGTVRRDEMASYLMRSAAGNVLMASIVIDWVYFGGYNFGDLALEEERITQTEYEEFQDMFNWYFELLDYQLSQQEGGAAQSDGRDAERALSVLRGALERSSK